MGTGTKIEWAQATWNPITGCTPISEGCKNCYAKRMATRLRGRYGYPEDEPFKVTFRPDRLEEPWRWRKPRKIFVCSMGDLLHKSVQDEWIHQVFLTMILCSQHRFMLLTKRPERMAEYILGDIPIDAGSFIKRAGYPTSPEVFANIWAGVTAENQRRADERIPILLDIPAAKRFVSIEPMIGSVDLSQWIDSGKLDWVICGGETGPGARWMLPGWVRDLRDQCEASGVPFFFKNWGDHMRSIHLSVYKKAPDRTIDGRAWDEEPE